MSISVLVHDTRLSGRTPLSSSAMVTFEVGEDTPLQDFFNRCRSISYENGGISTLYIMAHGVTMEFGGTIGGGYGIIFCREFIQRDNVDQFALLARKVENIVLLVCSAAATSFDIHHVDLSHPELSRTFHGDGNELCQQMAIRAQATVTAATEIQAYSTEEHCSTFAGYEFACEEGVIDFGDWEGTIVTYDPHGNIIDERTFPSAWRDSSGRVHGPGTDPGP